MSRVNAELYFATLRTFRKVIKGLAIRTLLLQLRSQRNDVRLALLRWDPFRCRFDFVDVIRRNGAEELCAFNAVAIDCLGRRWNNRSGDLASRNTHLLTRLLVCIVHAYGAFCVGPPVEWIRVATI